MLLLLLLLSLSFLLLLLLLLPFLNLHPPACIRLLFPISFQSSPPPPHFFYHSKFPCHNTCHSVCIFFAFVQGIYRVSAVKSKVNQLWQVLSRFPHGNFDHARTINWLWNIEQLSFSWKMCKNSFFPHFSYVCCLLQKFESNENPDMSNCSPHEVAGTLKMFFRRVSNVMMRCA